jgi:hypothetical protein
MRRRQFFRPILSTIVRELQLVVSQSMMMMGEKRAVCVIEIADLGRGGEDKAIQFLTIKCHPFLDLHSKNSCRFFSCLSATFLTIKCHFSGTIK